MKMYKTSTVRTLVDKFFSLQWCRDNLVVPLYEEASTLMSQRVIKIAVANFSYLGTIATPIKEILNESGFTCEFVEKSQEEIQEILDLASDDRFINDASIKLSEIKEDEFLEAIRETSDDSDDGFLFQFDDEEEEYKQEEILDLAVEMDESKIQKAAGLLLVKCINEDVSDIHIEPSEENFRIRVRKDGIMQKFMVLPRKPGIQLVTCLKNMAFMDIAEKRKSQDGKILRKFEETRMEFRCSTIPNTYGEKMVIRVLKSDASVLNLDMLIHLDDVRKKFRKIISSSNGMVIVSGPTGSGKSTTLAAALREIDNSDINIVTAEDPVEYKLGGSISQTQINRAKGQTFASVLRSFLRQDPDVILIGETRDPETAESSMDAADTGHLVFTTLHANSSTSSLTRLLDMDVPKYKLNASLRGVLAQRLVRRVCTGCAIKRQISESESIEFGIDEGTSVMYANALSSEEKFNRKRENTLCQQCQGSGYKGRIGVFELLLVDKKVQTAISKGFTDKEVEQLAVNENSMLTLRQYGLELVKGHLTTLSEVIRVCCN